MKGRKEGRKEERKLLKGVGEGSYLIIIISFFGFFYMRWVERGAKEGLRILALCVLHAVIVFGVGRMLPIRSGGQLNERDRETERERIMEHYLRPIEKSRSSIVLSLGLANSGQRHSASQRLFKWSRL